MDGTNFTLDTSSLCLVLLSAPARDVPSRAVDGEAFTPLADDACKHVDNPLSRHDFFGSEASEYLSYRFFSYAKFVGHICSGLISQVLKVT
jgi:hypothetical protein